MTDSLTPSGDYCPIHGIRHRLSDEMYDGPTHIPILEPIGTLRCPEAQTVGTRTLHQEADDTGDENEDEKMPRHEACQYTEVCAQNPFAGSDLNKLKSNDSHDWVPWQAPSVTFSPPKGERDAIPIISRIIVQHQFQLESQLLKLFQRVANKPTDNLDNTAAQLSAMKTSAHALKGQIKNLSKTDSQINFV